ncbi:NADPH-dependent FMN reductase [Roseibium algae]|uniref:NAD(P)H-dependent oxidoreductase n=1 Tax=Roseibium algae TaxID=3123038 RepID=A0ABU8TKT1_9HYPH
MTCTILALCGSLRASSSNRALLETAMSLQPAGLKIELYDGQAALPHFNPDLETAGVLPNPVLPSEVIDLRQRVRQADGLLIACPEYVHCLPGSFKNLLDWLVGCPDFPGKPVALFQATERHEYVPAMLRDVLTTMSAEILDVACFMLPATTNQIDQTWIEKQPALCDEMGRKLEAFAHRIAPKAP